MKYTLNDLTENDMELMTSASFLTDQTFMCFGKYFFKLRNLGLIDDQNNVTYYGTKVVKAWLGFKN